MEIQSQHRRSESAIVIKYLILYGACALIFFSPLDFI